MACADNVAQKNPLSPGKGRVRGNAIDKPRPGSRLQPRRMAATARATFPKLVAGWARRTFFLFPSSKDLVKYNFPKEAKCSKDTPTELVGVMPETPVNGLIPAYCARKLYPNPRGYTHSSQARKAVISAGMPKSRPDMLTLPLYKIQKN